MNIEHFFFRCTLNKCSAFVSEEISDLTNVKSEAARTRSFLSPSPDGACTPPAVQLPAAHPVAGGEPGGHQHSESLLWEAPREPPPLELDAQPQSIPLRGCKRFGGGSWSPAVTATEWQWALSQQSPVPEAKEAKEADTKRGETMWAVKKKQTKKHSKNQQ